MYHGTTSLPNRTVPHFTVFEPGWNDIGIHVGTIDQANDIVKVRLRNTRKRFDARVYPLYVRIERPLLMMDVFMWSPLAMTYRMAANVRDVKDIEWMLERMVRVRPETKAHFLTGAEVRKVLAAGDAAGGVDTAAGNAEARKVLIPMIQKRGYDGIVYRNKFEASEKPESSYIVFSPTQLKSATGNRGTFDPNDPDILHGWR